MNTQNAIIAKIATAALLAAAFVPGTAHAGTPLGDAQGYNLFILGDTSKTSSDIEGKIAVGGNATFSTELGARTGLGASINSVIVGGTFTETGSTVHGSVIAGGGITLSDPSVTGNVTSLGSVTSSSYGTINGNVQYGTTFTQGTTGVGGTAVQNTTNTLPINFASDATSLKSLSTSVAGLTTNGTTVYNYQGNSGGVDFQGNGTSQDVFTVDGSLLASMNTIVISADAGATVIINVTGSSTSFTLPSGGFTSNTSYANVIYNFSTATSISLPGSFYGNILAPNAAVTGNGTFNGELIAGSYSGNGQVNSVDGNSGSNLIFTGNITGLTSAPPAVPEPGMVVTTLSLAGMMGLALVKGRRSKVRTAAIAA